MPRSLYHLDVPGHAKTHTANGAVLITGDNDQTLVAVFPLDVVASVVVDEYDRDVAKK